MGFAELLPGPGLQEGVQRGLVIQGQVHTLQTCPGMFREVILDGIENDFGSSFLRKTEDAR